MKNLLYNALFPGKSKISFQQLFSNDPLEFRVKPRCEWECVPVFQDELVLCDDGVIFCHRNANQKTIL